MGFTGLNFLGCSHSFLSDFSIVDASNLLIECDLCKGRLSSANFYFEFL